MCPLSEDFDSLRTLTKCGPVMCPSLEDFVSLRTLTRCGPIMCPSFEDFVLLRTLTKCDPIMCPLSEGFVSIRALTKYGSNKRTHHQKVGTKQTVPQHHSTRNWTAISDCAAIWSIHWKLCITMSLDKKWHILYPSQDKWQMTRITHNKHCPMVHYWISMTEESILIKITWTSWRFLRADDGLFVNDAMIAEFDCRRLEQKNNGEAMLMAKGVQRGEISSQHW